MFEFPDEPSRSEGAVDCACRLLKRLARAETERNTWQRRSKAAESALVDKANQLHEVAATVNDWWSGGGIAPNAMKAISRVLMTSEAERHAD